MHQQQLSLDEDFNRYAEGKCVLERGATAVVAVIIVIVIDAGCTLSLQAEVYVDPVQQLRRSGIKAISGRLITSRTMEW